MNIIKVFSFILITILFSGCAGIAFSEFQDADSLGEGHTALTAGFSMGFEGRYQFSLTNNTDFGISLWSFNIINPFEEDQDIGLKLSLKQLISDKKAKHKVAFTASGYVYTSSYTIHPIIFPDMSEVNYDAWGVSPGIIYSYTFDRKNPEIDWPGNYSSREAQFPWLNPLSIYTGLKINYLSSKESVLHLADSAKFNSSQEIVFPMPFVGITWGEEHLQYYTEFIYLSRNIFPQTDLKPMFYVTFGVKFVFGL